MAFAYHSQPRPGHCEGKKQSTVRERTELFGWAVTFYLAETKGPSTTLEKISVMGFGGFFLYILTVTCVLCWPNWCNSLTWRGKGVYSKCERSFLFWHSRSPQCRPWYPYTCVSSGRTSSPPKSSPAPPFSERELARVSAVHGALSVGYTLLSAFSSSERLAADTVQGCFFPSRVARGLFPSKLEPCRDAGSHTGRIKQPLALSLLIFQLENCQLLNYLHTALHSAIQTDPEVICHSV